MLRKVTGSYGEDGLEQVEIRRDPGQESYKNPRGDEGLKVGEVEMKKRRGNWKALSGLFRRY